jgi:hypothetical protein
VEWWSGGVVEWWSGGVVEWWSGGVVEWWSGGVVEWWSVSKINAVLEVIQGGRYIDCAGLLRIFKAEKHATRMSTASKTDRAACWNTLASEPLAC